MKPIRRAGLLTLVPVVIAGVAWSAAAVDAGLTDARVDADAVPTTTIAPAVPSAAPVTPTTAPATLPPVPTAPVTESYVVVVDDFGMLTVEVPSTWTDLDTRPFVNDDNTLRPGIGASIDTDAFNDWAAPGVVYTAFNFEPDPNVLFGRYDMSRACTDAGTVPYSDGVFTGYQRTFVDCDAVGSTNHLIVANTPGNELTVVLIVQTVTPSDQAAYQHILDTFNVDLTVPMPTETVAPSTTTPLPTTPLPTTPLPTAPQPTIAPATAPQPTIAPATAPLPTVALPTVAPLPTSPPLTPPPSTALPGTVVAPSVPVPTVPGTIEAGGVPAGYVVVTDQTGRLSITVPATWTDTDIELAAEDGLEIAQISAAPSLAAFRETFEGPGVLYHETAYNPDPNAELASRGWSGSCTAGVVAASPNPNFTGVYQTWNDCGGTTGDIHVLVANPTDGRQVTVVIVAQTVTPADEEALKVLFSTFTAVAQAA